MKWLRKYDCKKVRFKDLTYGERMAVAWYMGVDGEAWQLDDMVYENPKNYSRWQKKIKLMLKKNMPSLIKKYGRVRFGVVSIPVEDIIERMLKTNPICIEKGWSCVEDMYKWYSEHNEIPKHRRHNWPVILSSFSDEVIQDGCHRFFRYVQSGVKKIPCIFYLTGELQVD